jgi:hypothetical protein
MSYQIASVDRRCLIVTCVVAAVATVTLAYPPHAGAQEKAPKEQEDWLDNLTERKSLSGPLHLLRFADGFYVLTKPIAWSPNPGQPHRRVEVPSGFVTDFASTPRAFWSFLPPDGDYAYAAIVHDYLYWKQDLSREESDEIFKLVMEDLKIAPTTVATIYGAVRFSGGSAWDSIAQMKATGEKRILKVFPNDPNARWQEFKMRPAPFFE